MVVADGRPLSALRGYMGGGHLQTALGATARAAAEGGAVMLTSASTDAEIAAAFWRSDLGHAVREGGQLRRHLTLFLCGGAEPLFDFDNEEDARVFFEEGAYDDIEAAVIAAWPEEGA